MKKQSARKTWSKKRHKFWYFVLKWPMVLFLKLKLHYKYRRLKYDRSKRYFIICNHQTDLDPIMLYVSFGRTIYMLATDTLFSNKRAGAFVAHTFAPIPKRKGVTDINAIKTMLQVVHEGKDVMLFPEGNRTYAEFQYEIDPAMVKLIRKCKLPLMILNLHGGTGISPRFAKKSRHGSLTCEMKKIIPYEELSKMTDDALYDEIRQGIRVYDSMDGKAYRSKKSAEFLERILFVCPSCHKMQTLRSVGKCISCSCGLKAEYTDGLRLASNHPDFKFSLLNDWYQYQKEFVRNYEIKENEDIFLDHDVRLFISHPYEGRRLVCEGDLRLTKDYLMFGDDVRINTSDILMASPISGCKFNFSTPMESYLVIGHERFNPLKYVFMFHKLDTHLKGNDIYYDIYK